MTIYVKIEDPHSPLRWSIECTLEEFKPKTIARIIEYIEDAVKSIQDHRYKKEVENDVRRIVRKERRGSTKT